jgi:diguanylate cyclase (GGDEF)-like protein
MTESIVQAPEASPAKPDGLRERLDVLLVTSESFWGTDPARALELATEAAEIARGLQDEESLARSLRFMGKNQHALSYHSKALTSLLEALERFKALGNLSQQAACLNEIGQVHSTIGDYAAAIEHIEAALKISRELHSEQGEIVSIFSIADIYKKLGKHAEAFAYYEHSLELAEKLGFQSAIAWTLRHLGELHVTFGASFRAQGDTERADLAFAEGLELLEEALRSGRALKEPKLVVETLIHSASAYADLSRFEQARDASLKALSAAREFDDPALEATALASMGRVYLRSGELPQALEHLRRSLLIYQSLGMKGEISHAHRRLALILKAKGEFAEALEHFERFYEFDISLKSEASERRAEMLSVKLGLEKSRRESELHRERSLELTAMNERLQLQAVMLDRQAREDALTGLSNRRHLEEYAAHAFETARARQQALTAVVADIDYFKSINDRFSHAIGDDVLRSVADILRAQCRDSDLIARYGGEEFVLLLDGLEARAAFGVCERIRLAVQNFNWAQFHPQLSVTLSLGLSDDLSLENHERLLSSADEQLYAAKRAGRNRVHPSLVSQPVPVRSVVHR